MTELEAEGMSEEDRLAPCLRALDEAEKALESGRLDEVSIWRIDNHGIHDNVSAFTMPLFLLTSRSGCVS